MVLTATKSPFRFKKNELKELLKNMVVVIDSREKKYNHIEKYLDRKQVNHRVNKLDFGDYTAELPAIEQLGVNRPLHFNDSIAIERKANLEELSQNCTQRREQFENELRRAGSAKLILMVEDKNGYENILRHNYETELNPKAYLATLQTYRHRYQLEIVFIDPKLSGNFIYYTLYYFLREYFKC